MRSGSRTDYAKTGIAPRSPAATAPRSPPPAPRSTAVRSVHSWRRSPIATWTLLHAPIRPTLDESGNAAHEEVCADENRDNHGRADEETPPAEERCIHNPDSLGQSEGPGARVDERPAIHLHVRDSAGDSPTPRERPAARPRKEPRETAVRRLTAKPGHDDGAVRPFRRCNSHCSHAEELITHMRA